MGNQAEFLQMKLDIVGKKFGRLLVIEQAARGKNGDIIWRCRCDCGAELNDRKWNLERNQSCGCARRERASQLMLRHGHARITENRPSGLSRTYQSWMAMKARCFRTSHHNYRYYGARGITVCERWLTFDNFLADMGERPGTTSIDRINCDGNYEPGNCRWADAITQRNNRRKSK